MNHPVGGTSEEEFPDPGVAVRSDDGEIGIAVPEVIENSIGRPLVFDQNGTGVEMPVFAEGFAAGEAEFLLRVGATPPAGKMDYSLAEAAELLDAVHVGIEVASSPLGSINEIGPIIAQSVYDFLHSKYGRETIEDLEGLGVKMKSAAAGGAGSRALEGKTLVVTGTLVKYTRDEIQELIARQGGRAASSVSKNTDYVVAGGSAGSKLSKAQKLGVPVLTEEQFEKLLRE